MTPLAGGLLFFTAGHLALSANVRSIFWVRNLSKHNVKNNVNDLKLESVIHCSLKCFHVGCRAMMYASSKRCLLMVGDEHGEDTLKLREGLYTSFDMVAGNQNYFSEYGKSCFVDSDCKTKDSACLDRNCQCHPGYSFDARGDECLAKCQVYGKTFSLQAKGYCVSYHTARKIPTISSFDRCRNECLSEKNFLCKSFELYSEKCYLATVTKLDVLPSEWEPWYKCRYYQRNCG